MKQTLCRGARLSRTGVSHFARNPLVRAAPVAAYGSLGRIAHTTFRNFSDDSHPDFMPKRKVAKSSEDAMAMIKQDVTSNKVFLYMKGNPQQPMCGFSKQVATILQYLDVPFGSRDVLVDAHIRSAIKEYSDWPTIPQLYIGGEFVGGCDIVTNMFKEGDLLETLKAHGVPFKVPKPLEE